MPRALKVFRTSTGFHDAYVAVPTKKAALEAWGAEKDLFAIGAAEIVTDPSLSAEPLAAPGTVIKRSRGSAAEHIAAQKSTGSARSLPARVEASSGTKAKPRPNRQALDAAEAALDKFNQQADAEIADLRDRERALQRERDAVEARHQKQFAKLTERAAVARQRHETALDAWRRAME